MDARVKVTKILIKNAFIDLLGKLPLNKITVTEICHKAEINRMTFYKYYNDPYDLYEKLVAELIEESSQFFDNIDDKSNLKEVINNVIMVIYENINQCKTLFSNNVDDTYLNKSFELCMNRMPLFRISELNISEEEHELLKSFLSYGGRGILITWIQNDVAQKPEDIANQIYIYINQILKLYK